MGLGERIASYFVSIGADTTGMQQGFQQTKTGMSGLTKAVGIGVAVIGSQIARMAVSTAVELGKMSAQHDRLALSMDQLANQYGGSSRAIMQSLRQMSGGTVDDMSLMLGANRAMMLGLGADADKMGQLMEVARFRGRAMGLTTAQAFSDIVTGIGRASPMILDNLGIVIDADKTYSTYAESLGKTSSALTDVEKKQALLNKVLTEGGAQIDLAGGIEDDDVDRMERLQTKIENLKLSWGEAISPTVMSVVDKLIYIVDRVGTSNGARSGGVYESEAFAGVTDLAKERQKLLSDLAMYQERQQLRPEGSMGWNMLQDDIRNTKEQLDIVSDKISEKLTTSTAEFGAGWNGIPGAIQPTIDAVDELNQKLVDSSTYWSSSIGGATTLQFISAESDPLVLKMKGREEATERATEAIDKQNNAITTQTDEIDKLAIAEADRLKSTIMGYMTPTSVTALDMYRSTPGNALGPYQNKWDEYGRRMQDIINNGEGSPFASQYFGGMGGDELKYSAMQGQEDFYAGVNWDQLSPEDRESMIQALVTKVQRGQEGQANRQEIAGIVAGRLGVDVGTVSELGGLGLMGEEGKTAGGDIMAGINEMMGENEFIAPLAQAFRDDLATNKQLLIDAGKSAGSTLTAGALTAVKETQWITAMATAVAPEVARILERESER